MTWYKTKFISALKKVVNQDIVISKLFFQFYLVEAVI